MPKKPPFKIGFREEGAYVNCYLIPLFTPEPGTDSTPLRVASVLIGALRKTPGLFDDYKAMMLKAVGAALMDTGVTDGADVTWETRDAPDSEREGEA